MHEPRRLCRYLGLPVVTRDGLGMTCERDSSTTPSAQVEVPALILPRKIKLCRDCIGEPPCTGHEPAYSVDIDFRIGW